MKQISVLKKFTLSLDDGSKRDFSIGVHEVDDAVADHWFVQANSEAVVTSEPKKLAKNNQTPAATTGKEPTTETTADAVNADAATTETKPTDAANTTPTTPDAASTATATTATKV